MAFDIEIIKELYEKYPERIQAARIITQKPLTLAEKNSLHTSLEKRGKKTIY